MTAVERRAVHPSEADDLDFDDENEAHLARHNVTPLEVVQVHRNQPVYVPNKAGVTAPWLMLGDTDGGRPLTVAVICLEAQLRLRPITGRTSEPLELARWRPTRGR
jgi:hypothetical protein